MFKRFLRTLFGPQTPAETAETAPSGPETPPLPIGFYIEPNDCITMGICLDEAPSSVKWDGTEHGDISVEKQPETPDEIAKMLIACSICPVYAIRYNGPDPKVREAVEQILDHDNAVEKALPPIEDGPWRLEFFKG